VALLVNDEADVVFGSRFLSTGAHRVLYYWHSVGNRILTLLSNMFTDLNLTDMEAGYKVFRRDILQRITIEENRFGFEPEIVAKAARMRLRIYEMGISYHGRTYAEGKKVGVKDGIRALYCICRYNAHSAPLPLQLLLYTLIGGLAAVVNLAVFLGIFRSGGSVAVAAPIAFAVAAAVNYFLCVSLLFKHRVRWNSAEEVGIFLGVVCAVGLLDVQVTDKLLKAGLAPGLSKLAATAIGFTLNFIGRRFVVFQEPTTGPWKSEPAAVVAEPSTAQESWRP
jgi:putative flippase GtrA